MKIWLICISGFTEQLGEHTGTIRLWDRLLPLQSRDNRVEIRLWDEDWKQYAALIANSSSEETRILVCAYSWGAGYGFRQLAKHLQSHGKTIETAVLCDPIFRSRTLLGRWLALVPGLRVKVPRNVGDVYWLYQRNDYLQGHAPIKAPEAGTYIHPGIEVDASHGSIDESPEYQDLADREARRICKFHSNHQMHS